MKYEKDFETKKGKKVHFKLSVNRLAFGLLFIACAVLIILDAVGFSLGFLSGIPAWVLILTALNLVWLIDLIVKLKISEVFIPIAFIFMLLEKYIAGWCGLGKSNIINNWLVFLCALLLMIGAKLITPKRRFGKRFSKIKHNHTSPGTASTVYVDCETEDETVTVKNELGACNVYFSNVESYKGGMVLEVYNELGAMTIHVPKEWNIVTNIKNELGAVSASEEEGTTDKTIFINGKNELGSVRITRA
ncbi:MAG: hypothetical protein J6L23_01835 [Clostridia bacterium]|nr:hypothetical protein [Clostridia bacterium]MBP3387252.1 hypothetical protein [Clostridia bacterium]